MPSVEKITALLFAAIVGGLLIAWVNPGSPQLTDLSIKRMQFAALSKPDITTLDASSFVPAREPFRHQGRFGVARISFDVTDPVSADLALFIRRVRDNYSVYVNGKLAAPTPGVLGEPSTLHGFLPRLVKVLPTLLVQGTNTIDIVSARNATQSVLKEVYFGPTARLEPAYLHTQAVVHDAGFITALAAGIVLLFSLALSSLIRNPVLIRTIAVVLALFLLRELHALWIDRAWPQMYRDIYLILVATLLWISLAAFTNEWTGGAAALQRWLIVGAAVASALIAGFYAVLSSCHEAYAAGSLVESLIGLGALGFMMWRMFWHYYAAPASTWAEIAVAVVGVMMAVALLMTQTGAIPGLASMVSVEGEAFTKLGAMAMIAFIALGLARHGIGVYQQAALNNEALSRKVEAASREIEANHVLLREQDRERALAAERGRIMRDVHDGIGSQLLGLLIQARAGEAKGETLIGGLQAAIDDLYLVVDSLDGVPGSLETALGTFRGRIAPKCAAAGIEVVWQMDEIGDTPSVGPTTVLQIYRILQEALSNAIRHAQPRQLIFRIARQSQDRSKIEISLRDDGPGFSASALGGPGRGLANMKKRAASIGAELRIESHSGGACLHLLLPA